MKEDGSTPPSQTQKGASISLEAGPLPPSTPRSLLSNTKGSGQNNGIDELTLFLQAHPSEQHHAQDSTNDAQQTTVSNGAQNNTGHTGSPLPSVSTTTQTVPTITAGTLGGIGESPSGGNAPNETSVDTSSFASERYDCGVSMRFGVEGIDDGCGTETTELDFYNDNGLGLSDEDDDDYADFNEYDNEEDEEDDEEDDDDEEEDEEFEYISGSDSDDDNQKGTLHLTHDQEEYLEHKRKEEQRDSSENNSFIRNIINRKRKNSLIYKISKFNSVSITPPKPDTKPPQPSTQKNASQPTPPSPPTPPQQQSTPMTTSLPPVIKKASSEVKAPVLTTKQPIQTATKTQQQIVPKGQPSQLKDKTLVPPVKLTETPRAGPQQSTCATTAQPSMLGLARTQPKTKQSISQILPSIQTSTTSTSSSTAATKGGDAALNSPKGRPQNTLQGQRPASTEQKQQTHVWARAVCGHLNSTPQRAFSRATVGSASATTSPPGMTPTQPQSQSQQQQQQSSPSTPPISAQISESTQPMLLIPTLKQQQQQKQKSAENEASIKASLPAVMGSFSWQKRQYGSSAQQPQLKGLTLEQQQPLQPLSQQGQSGAQQQPAIVGSQQQTQQQAQRQQKGLAQAQGTSQTAAAMAQNDPALRMMHGAVGQQFTTIIVRAPGKAGTFKPELLVKPCRFFGVHLQNLCREQLTRGLVPNIVERSLNYLEVAIVNRIERNKSVYVTKEDYPRVNTWSVKDTTHWLESELGISGLGSVVESNGLTGKRLLALTEKEGVAIFGKDRNVAAKVLSGVALLDSLQRRGDTIVRGGNMDDTAIRELFTLVEMWNCSMIQVVDYFKLKSTPAVVCTLLKQYFRELPVPLIPLSLFATAINTNTNTNSAGAQQQQQNQQQNGAKNKLKDFSWNRLLAVRQNFNSVAWETLCRILQFLHLIVHDKRSLVSLKAVSEAFGPALCKPQCDPEAKLARRVLKELVRTYPEKAPEEEVFCPSMMPREFMYGEIIISGEPNIRSYFGPTVPCVLQGADYIGFLHARNWINGVIYFTNYRIIWEPFLSVSERDKAIATTFAREIPIASISNLSVIKESADKQDPKSEVFVGKIVTRDLGIYYFQFLSQAVLTRFTEDVARTKDIAPFAWVNRELCYLPLATRRELGWNVYRPAQRLAPFVGEGGSFTIQDMSKLRSSLASDDVYPMNCVVPNELLPSLQSLIKSHRL